MNMNRVEEPIPRGPGRRTNAEKYAEQNEAHHSKFPTTIDIKFDAKNSKVLYHDLILIFLREKTLL